MNAIANTLKKRIVANKPLILCLTNHVTPGFIANGLLSLGASPLMSASADDIAALLPVTACVVINIGTLDASFIQLIEQVSRMAYNAGVPIVLDPVGAGATPLRTQTALKLLSMPGVSLIRGNAGEVMSLLGHEGKMKGVDSQMDSLMAIEVAQQVAQRYGVVVAMSGAIDVITDGRRVEKIARGSAMMPYVVGTGCLLSAVLGAFIAVAETIFDAALYGSYYYAVCGERAELLSHLPGSFQIAFLDALYLLLEENNA